MTPATIPWKRPDLEGGRALRCDKDAAETISDGSMALSITCLPRWTWTSDSRVDTPVPFRLATRSWWSDHPETPGRQAVEIRAPGATLTFPLHRLPFCGSGPIESRGE